jgi:hypothetical protein
MTPLPRPLVTCLMLLFLLTTSAFALALPAGWKDYTVQAGDTCALVALKTYGDATRYDLVHQGNPDLGPEPHKLKAGQVLHLPPAPPDAKLTSVRNTVQVNAAPGRPNDPLFRGNRVTTASSAAADIEFRDTTDLELGENTLVVIFGDSAARAAKSRTASDVTLMNGRLRAHLAELAGGKPAKPVTIETAAGLANVGPGEIQIHVDEKKTTRLAVYQGHSSITAQRRTVKVDQGFGSKADDGKPPTPPRPLPPAPVWSTPFPQMVLATDAVGPTVAGTYAAGTGPGDAPAAWHVAIANDERFRDIVVDARVSLSVVRLEARELKRGTYFARVSAIDADKFEGAYGPVARIVVADVKVAPEPDHHATLDVLPHGFACAVGDSPLTPVVAPLAFDRHASTQLHCAATMRASASAVATLDLPGDRIEPKPVEPPPAPVRVVVAPPLSHWEAALGAGIATPDGDPSHYAGRAELGAGWKTPVGPGWIALGAQVAFEYSATYDVGPGKVQPIAFAVGVPIAFRWGRAAPRFAPYVQVTPEVLVQRTDYTLGAVTQQGHATLLGLTGSLGVQARLGLGAIYLQGGYRGTGSVHEDANQVVTRGGVFTLGYRGDL